MTTGMQPALATAAPSKAPMDPIFRQIRDLVYKVSGIYQLDEKIYLLSDGCARRIKLLNVKSPREYWDLLTAHASREVELRQLLNEITIGETCLFRSQPQLDALHKIILPELVIEKTKQVTSACASGAPAVPPARSPTPSP